MNFKFNDKLIFEKSMEGRRCFLLPECDCEPWDDELYKIDDDFVRNEELNLPQISESDLIRHYTNLSHKIFGTDNGFYPLGSCTMKYNPKINEQIAAMKNFTDIHPLQPVETAQGCLEVMHLLENYLCEIAGMDSFTLQPAAGAQGEFLGLQLIKKYFAKKGENQRTKAIVPDSAHGTNPASAAMCGFDVITVPSKSDGSIDIDKLKEVVSDETAVLMLTNPNTVGLFEYNIVEAADIVHKSGGLLYYDGANMNAIMGITRPGDMGFDVVHLNLHKTFSTPHGGGGPGSGPVGCKAFLTNFLPNPSVQFKDGRYFFDDNINLNSNTNSIGKITGFYGNFLVYLKALAYICSIGGQGLKDVSENAVLNANYLMQKLTQKYTVAYPGTCMHEFVLSAEKLKKDTGVSAMDISKSMTDYGIHPPTMYFPLIVNEALMFEPTETESKETLDEVVKIMLEIYDTALNSPESLHNAPVNAPISRPDEVLAARNPKVIYTPNSK